MKIVLTHGYFLEEDGKEQAIMRPYPPLGMLYVSAYLKQAGKAVSVIDTTFMNRTQWKESMLSERPDIVAFYVNLIPKTVILELIPFLRELLPDCILIGGGPDVTFNLTNYHRFGFDYLISGEGEVTMLELINCLESGGDPYSVAGISFLRSGELVQTATRSFLPSLDTLPFPDREAAPIEEYLKIWEEYHGQRTLNISTQRGCPYSCNWCSTSVFGQSYRRTAPARVVEEILHMKANFGVEAIWFVDDVFTVNHNWIRELHACFLREHLTIPFEIVTRAERLDEEILGLLHEMGCFRIWIGAESGSQRIIDRMNRKVQLDVVREMIRLTRKTGMEAGTFVMVGYPGEEIKDIVHTKRHLQDCLPDMLTITKVYPIKGTPLYDEVIESATVPGDWSSSTDREIEIRFPHSGTYYKNAIRYLMHSWNYKRNRSLSSLLKYKAAFALMKLHQ